MLVAYAAAIASAGLYQSQIAWGQNPQPARPGKATFISGAFICDCTQPTKDCYCVGPGS
ncbi:MAG TPA: hypothetical protein VF634_13610 [Pyrinomonadaceae bacterium]